MDEKLRVPFDDLDYMFDDESHSIYDGALYKGQPFTGIAIDDDGRSHFEMSFFDGMPHGRSFEISKTGVLVAEFYAENGEILQSTDRNWDGSLIEEYSKSPFFKKKWYENGQLKYEQTDDHVITYRKDGSIRSTHLKSTGICTYFAVDGEWTYKVEAERLSGFCPNAENTHFNHEYIEKHFVDMLEHDFDELSLFLLWLGSFIRNESKTGEVIASMISSDNLQIKYEGLILAEECKRKDLIPLIIKQLSVHSKPPRYVGFEGNGCLSYMFTVAEYAQKVLNSLSI